MYSHTSIIRGTWAYYHINVLSYLYYPRYLGVLSYQCTVIPLLSAVLGRTIISMYCQCHTSIIRGTWAYYHINVQSYLYYPRYLGVLSYQCTVIPLLSAVLGRTIISMYCHTSIIRGTWAYYHINVQSYLYYPRYLGVLSYQCTVIPLLSAVLGRTIISMYCHTSIIRGTWAYYHINVLSYLYYPRYLGVLSYQCTVIPLLSAVLGRTKFWSQKPWINEVRG